MPLNLVYETLKVNGNNVRNFPDILSCLFLRKSSVRLRKNEKKKKKRRRKLVIQIKQEKKSGNIISFYNRS